MARNSTPESPQFSDDPSTEVDESQSAPLELNEQELADAAEAEAVGTDSTEAPAEVPADGTLTEEQKKAAAEAKSAETLANFKTVVDQVAAGADENGHLTPDQLSPAVQAYRAIEGGLKARNQGKDHVAASMKAALMSGPDGFAKALSWNLIQDAILAAPAKASGKGDKEPAAPVDPAKAYAERVATFRTAFALVAGEAVEGYEQHLPDETKLAEEAKRYLDWATSTAEDKGDAPEVSAIAVAAAKLSLGKAAKVRKAKGEGGAAAPVYTGPRRNVAAHIENAFADVPSGTFLKISEIRAVKSDEYGDDAPSAGAVSARLFPASGNCTVAGVTPGQDAEGNRGATKV